MNRFMIPAPRAFATASLIAFSAWIPGCRSAPGPEPAAHISEPGWGSLQGQAVWKPGRSRTEIAGDVLIATNVNGSAVILFSKDPFTIATATVSPDRWRIEFPAARRTWQGKGRPPGRFAWLQLPAVVRMESPGKAWIFQSSADGWLIENPRTGERLEGRFLN